MPEKAGTPSSPQTAWIAVPCYNEEERLDEGCVLELARHGHTGVILVDDGSTDGTAGRLAGLSQKAPEAIEVLPLDRNRGKAEAVRRGMLRAIEKGAGFTGFIDADFSVPAAEMLRMMGLMREREAHVVLPLRTGPPGSRVRRSLRRRLMGRGFALCVSWITGLPTRDSQCGAKGFRVSGLLRAVLEEPFLNRWAFDVELIGRLLAGAENHPPLSWDRFVEIPLEDYREVEGSKVGVFDIFRMGFGLWPIRRDLRRRRRRFSGA